MHDPSARRERSLGKARTAQVPGQAGHGRFEHRVADQVIFALLAIGNDVVAVEMEAHVDGKIRQPVNTGLQSHRLALGEKAVERAHRRFGAPVALLAPAHAESLFHVLDDDARRVAIAGEGNAAHFHERQVQKKQPAADPEGQAALA